MTLTSVTVDGVALGNVTLAARLRRPHAVRRRQRQRAGQRAPAERLSGRRAAVGLGQRQGPRGRHLFERPHHRSRRRSRSPTSTASNDLKRIDGGAFVATDESGPPTYNAPGKIVGSSLEGSNTDIADEFTKLIVTQQAYSANTRVITTSNQMVQDLLNMLR